MSNTEIRLAQGLTRTDARLSRIANFIRDGLDAHRFANSDVLLIAVDAAFPDALFAEFVGGYFLALRGRQ